MHNRHQEIKIYSYRFIIIFSSKLFSNMRNTIHFKIDFSTFLPSPSSSLNLICFKRKKEKINKLLIVDGFAWEFKMK